MIFRLAPRHRILFPWFALASLSVFACSGDNSRGADSLEEAVTNPIELDPEGRAELLAAGFTVEEIEAVAESITISEALSVRSFVDEANSGELAFPWDANGSISSNPTVRRESHGKQHGCLRARF